MLEGFGNSCVIIDDEQKLQLSTAEFSYAANAISMLDHIQSKLNKFGDRVKETANKGMDWKSIVHAIRIYWQCIDMMDKGYFLFPIDPAKRAFLLDVKAGKWDGEFVRNLLSTLDEEVLCLREKVLEKEQRQGKNIEANIVEVKQIISAYLDNLYGVSK